jgi:hypothetical protein
VAYRYKSVFVIFAIALLGWAASASGQSSDPTPAPTSAQPLVGNVSGTVVDQSGAVVAGANIKLSVSGADQSTSRDAVSGDGGQFSFANVAPGAFQLTVSATGFASQSSSGVLRPGETYLVPEIALEVATNLTEVKVSLSQVDVAEEQIKVEEKQRVLGVIPNFYVSYDPHAVPLTSKQKFKLAARTVVDPFTFVIVAGTAGMLQGQDHFHGYGQGTEGYAKRFGAIYGDTLTGTFIGGAILPSILKQDPRYFYKGTGSDMYRISYAVANSVICKGDNGHWQPNYSNILGSLAAGGISNLYYPEQDRDGAALTFENAAVGIGINAISNLFQEFILRKISPKNHNNEPAKP